MTTETIAAISTPPGNGGIGVVRVCGPAAFSIVDPVFKGKQSINGSGSHVVLFGRLLDPKAGNEPIDEVLITVMRSPRTYTGEDTVEISCHGGSINTRRVLELVLDQGARLAEPGEFTKLAFLNGRIDLSQAEAVAELISARTDAARKASLALLMGRLTTEVKGLRQRLLDLCSLLELDLDFAEENLLEIDSDDVIQRLRGLASAIEHIVSSYRTGHLLREGARVTLIGKPNTGKSTLLNQLIQRERAIVSETPGTTRDFIEEIIDINGIPFTLIDTAGIRDTVDAIEKAGIELTERHSEFSDLVLAVFDVSEPFTDDDRKVIRHCSDLKERKSIHVLALLNKADLQELHANTGLVAKGGLEAVTISAKNGDGLGTLKDKISDLYGEWTENEPFYLSNLRQKNLFEEALTSVRNAEDSVRKGLSFEFAAVDLRGAMSALGEVIGETTTDQILDNIFSNFCIGK